MLANLDKVPEAGAIVVVTFPKPKGGGVGDELVKVKIVLPSSLTDAEIELYQKLKTLRTDNPRAYQG